MANSIEQRIAEFIQLYPPFDQLTESELTNVARSIHVEYHGPSECIFKEGSSTTSFFYVVRKGSVRIHHEDHHQSLVDLCDEGDVFGVRPLLANEAYLASASTVEETLLYAIPVETGIEILKSNPEVSLYLARGYASGMPMSREQRRTSVIDLKMNTDVPDEVGVSGSNYVVSCSPSTTVQEASIKMDQANVASIIVVDPNGCPLGIMTDSDLRRKVVSKALNLQTSISEIMAQPVLTVKKNITHSEALIAMMKYGIHHLCITENGKTNTAAIGVIAERDLMLDQGLHPAVLMKFIRLAKSQTELISYRTKLDALLDKYREREAPIDHVTKIAATVNDSIVERSIQIFEELNGKAPMKYCWISLGSMGRLEQILKTDQDHALILEKTPDHTEETYFRQMGEYVSHTLEKWGLSEDIAGISAANSTYGVSLNEWKHRFTTWLRTPEPESILNSSIFFDLRPVAGQEALGLQLKQHILASIDHNGLFFPMMANDALKISPPLSFFRQFIVEKNGEHKDEFDLKKRALLPFCDIARILSLHAGFIESSNTMMRFEYLALQEESNRHLFNEASNAYGWLLKLRWTKGTLQGDGGRYINLQNLSKRERQRMRDIFGLLSDLEQIVKVRFQTDRIGI